MKNILSKFWYNNKPLILFITLMVVFRGAVADWNPVPTGSMQPTIVEGDVIIVNKLAYDVQLPFTHTSLLKLGDPERGDIIVFESKASDLRLVKRVVGIPGDTLEMLDKQLIINGIPLDYQLPNTTLSYPIDLTEDLLGIEHFVRFYPSSRHSSFTPITMPEGYYFAMGDSRDNSADSRVIGLVPRSEIIGRSRHIVLSFDMDNNYIPRSDRFFHKL